MRSLKRGQAALEQLTTYWWAVLMILIIGVVLSYYSFFYSKNNMAGKCVLGTEVYCLDHSMLSGNLRLLLKNNLNSEITNFSLKIDGCGQATAPERIIAFGTGTFSVGCQVSGDTLKAKMNFSFKDTNSGINHIIKGEILTNARG